MWMGVCTAFVFAALVEFTCVNYLWRKTSMSRPRYALNSQGLCPTNGHNSQGQVGETGAPGTSQEIVELNLVRFSPRDTFRLYKIKNLELTLKE